MAERGMLKFEHIMDVDGGFVLTKLGGTQSQDCNFRGRKSAKAKFELVYLGKY